MDAPFGTVDEWKRTLLLLPQESFFDVIGRVMGNVTMPYSRKNIVEQLAAFLSHNEHKQVMTAYLDEKDTLVIAAIAALHCPDLQELKDFLGLEINGREVAALLVNMEERFIIYRFQQETLVRMALNPLFRNELEAWTRNSGALFPSTPLSHSAPPDPSIDDRIMVAVLAFVLEKERIFKADREMRRNVADEAKLVFPDFPLKDHIGALMALHILFASDERDRKGEKIVVDYQKLDAFVKRSRRERLEYYVAGLYLFRNKSADETDEIAYMLQNAPNYFHQGQIRTSAAFIHQFLDFFKAGVSYPRITLQRITVLLQYKGLGEAQDKSVSLPNLEVLLGLLEDVRILLADEDSSWRLNGAFHHKDVSTGAPSIAMDGGFSFVLYPEIDFVDALEVAAFSTIRMTGAAVQFELTLNSVVRGFNRGFSSESILTLLSRLSGTQMGQTLAWTLKDWEKQYQSVSIYRGMVLCLAEPRRYLAETGLLSDMIAKVLAPGVYFLFDTEKSKVVKALQKAGVAIIGEAVPAKAPLKTNEGNGDGVFPALVSEAWTPVSEVLTPPTSNAAERYREHFRTVLRTLALPEPKRAALEQCIDQHLVLNASQLREECIRNEKLEARTFDHAGKIELVRAAIYSKSLIEIRWFSAEKAMYVSATGTPESLAKMGGKSGDAPRGSRSILTLKPVAEGATIIVPLEKVSAVRLIKRTAFE
jgi:hypothetical protein